LSGAAVVIGARGAGIIPFDGLIGPVAVIAGSLTNDEHAEINEITEELAVLLATFADALPAPGNTFNCDVTLDRATDEVTVHTDGVDQGTEIASEVLPSGGALALGAWGGRDGWKGLLAHSFHAAGVLTDPEHVDIVEITQELADVLATWAAALPVNEDLNVELLLDRSADEATLYVDTVADSTEAISIGLPSGGELTIGATEAGRDSWDNLIGIHAVFDRPLTTDERNAIEAYRQSEEGPVLVADGELMLFASLFPGWVPPDALDDLDLTRLPFPRAQAALRGGTIASSRGTARLSWHSTSLDPERGSVAIARTGSPFADLVGERLQITVAGRSVNVYCHAESPELDEDEDLSLPRALFTRLVALSTTTVLATTEVIG
jgi:hypothetical protein